MSLFMYQCNGLERKCLLFTWPLIVQLSVAFNVFALFINGENETALIDSDLLYKGAL
jgi:hypothetical protein